MGFFMWNLGKSMTDDVLVGNLSIWIREVKSEIEKKVKNNGRKTQQCVGFLGRNWI